MSLKRELKALHLEPLSFRFARLLFERHPEWLKWATAEEQSRDGLSVFTLRVEIPSSHPIVDKPLLITSGDSMELDLAWAPTGAWCAGWDILVWAFDHHSRRRVPLAADLETERFRGFIDLIEDAIAERRVWAFEGNDFGNWTTFGLTPLSDVRPECTIRSWRGTYDREPLTAPAG